VDLVGEQEPAQVQQSHLSLADQHHGPCSSSSSRSWQSTTTGHPARRPHTRSPPLNESAAQILHVISTGATYEEVTEVLETHYGDHHLEAAFHFQLKRRIQLVGKSQKDPACLESLQEFAAVIDHLAHRTHVELPK
jgi:hypothetical protein